MQRLDAYVDQELVPTERARIDAHLHDCWNCSGEVQTRRRIRASLRQLGRQRPHELGSARLRDWAVEQLG